MMKDIMRSVFYVCSIVNMCMSIYSVHDGDFMKAAYYIGVACLMMLMKCDVDS